MQATGGGQSPLERAEHEGEDDLERAMESIDRIGERRGVLGDHGWASCKRSARPAPRNTSASRSTCQMVEPGPNTPSAGPGALLRTMSMPRSKSIPPMDGGFAAIAKTSHSC